MKNPIPEHNPHKELEKFHETVGILVKAYLNDELRHGNCSACAVGNIISAHGVEPLYWHNVFVTVRSGQHNIHMENYVNRAKEEIDSTGYGPFELARIENAFELCALYIKEEEPGDCFKQIGDIDEQMFNGLMAVVDVLADIHKVDLTTKENSKLLFVK